MHTYIVPYLIHGIQYRTVYITYLTHAYSDWITLVAVPRVVVSLAAPRRTVTSVTSVTEGETPHPPHLFATAPIVVARGTLITTAHTISTRTLPTSSHFPLQPSPESSPTFFFPFLFFFSSFILSHQPPLPLLFSFLFFFLFSLSEIPPLFPLSSPLLLPSSFFLFVSPLLNTHTSRRNIIPLFFPPRRHEGYPSIIDYFPFLFLLLLLLLFVTLVRLWLDCFSTPFGFNLLDNLLLLLFCCSKE